MTTNINLKLKPEQHIKAPIQAPLNQPLSYPSIAPMNDAPEGLSDYAHVNFTPPVTETEYPRQQPQSPPTITEAYPYPSPAYNLPQPVPRSVDLSGALVEQKAALEAKVKVLEALLNIYESAPILIKGLIIVTNKKLIEIIQTLTGCEKVELLLDDYVIGCCGSSSNASIATVTKIFVVDSQGTRNEFKVAYNAEYSLLLRHGVSLKLVRTE
jgi:hypothetical protein